MSVFRPRTAEKKESARHKKESARHDTGRGGDVRQPRRKLSGGEGQLRRKGEQPYLGGRI